MSRDTSGSPPVTATTRRARTRGHTACSACRSRRSKCDSVNDLGCHRCQQLGTECSLAGNGNEAFRSHINHHDTDPRLDNHAAVFRRLAEVEARLKSFDTASNRGNVTIGKSFGSSSTRERHGIVASTSTSKSGSSGSDVYKSQKATWRRPWTLPERYGLLHRGLYGNEEEILSDPIAQGVITSKEADMAFHLFKYHFAHLYPHPCYTSVSSPAPEHPILLSAVLLFTSRCTSPTSLFSPNQQLQIEALVMEHLNAYFRGCPPSLEAIQAAFILSFLPPDPCETRAASIIDPFRMINLAVAQVNELGGDSVYIERMLGLLRSGVPIRSLESQLSDCRLFLSVFGRAAWFTYTRSLWSRPGCGPPESHRQLLTWLGESGEISDIDRRLVEQHRFIDHVSTSATAWHALQHKIVPSANDVTAGNEIVAWTKHVFEGTIPEMNLQGAPAFEVFPIVERAYYRWWESVRNVWTIMRIPTPLRIEAIYSGYLSALQLGAQAGINLLETCMAQRGDLAGYPMYVSNGFNVAYYGLVIGRLHCRYLVQGQSFPSCMDVEGLLDSARALLETTTGQLNKHYSMIRKQIESEHTRVDAFYSFSAGAFNDDDLEAIFRQPPHEQSSEFFNPFTIDGWLDGGENLWDWTANFAGRSSAILD